MRKCLYLVVLAALLLLAACAKPGEGAKADAGYKLAAPVIDALQTYHALEGRYPAALDALVPVYLDTLPRETVTGPLQYKLASDGSGYELSFRYTGPGMNVCTYKPDASWRCYGYY